MTALKLGTETGSLVNHLMSHVKSTPKVGEGATMLQWSDRTPYKVLGVSENGKEVKLCRMATKIISGSTQSEEQEYEYSETNDIVTIVYRYKNWYVKSYDFLNEKMSYNKINIVFGKMEKYNDPTF
ncbi:MAG: hypothetical protein ACRDD8_09530 [Bacteroidales bacterium]